MILGLFSFFVGFIAAFLSLAVSVLFSVPTAQQHNYDWIIIFVFIEEILKLLCLLFLFNVSSQFERLRNIVMGSITFGIGFGFFEITLAFMNLHQIISSMLLLPIVHSFFALLLGYGIFVSMKKHQKWITFACLLLAIVFHVCYNLIVINLSI